MWSLTLHGTRQLDEVEDIPKKSARSRPVLCVLTLTARPAISTGDVRQIKRWNFSRDEPKRGPKLKPIEEVSDPALPTDLRRTFHLTHQSVYIADSVDQAGARLFEFFLIQNDELEFLTREQVREHFFVLDGATHLKEALDELAWTRAWLIAQQAPVSQRDEVIAECIAALRAALARTPEAELEGRPKQIQWAEPLRHKATNLLRVTWRQLRAHPTLPRTRPRLLYALMTCAWFLKTQPRADLFIAADYHITRAQVAEIVDRFSALGRQHAGPKTSLAPPLSTEELAIIQNLAGAIKP